MEDLKCDLNQLSVGFDVQGGISQQHRVLRGVVEGVMSDLLYVVSVGDDAMLDGVLKS